MRYEVATGIYIFLTVLLSWWIGLSYIRVKLPGIAFHALTFAAVCGASSFLLERAGAGQYIYLTQAVAFLLAATVVQLQQRGEYGDAVMALLLAQGADAVLMIAWRALSPEWWPVGLVPPLVLAIGFIAMTFKLRGRFPEAQWREYFVRTVPEPGRIELRLWHIYLVPLATCAILSTLEFAARPTRLLDVALLSATAAAVYVWGLMLLILMHTYKKERITLLLEQQYREELQVFLNVIRSQRHDYNFHVQTIAGLIQNDKLEECRRYVSALEQDSSVMNAVLPLKDAAISSTVHSFRMLVARSGVELHVDIQNDLAQIATNVYETNKIISNLLQNALDETQGQSDKSYGIMLCILKRGEYCVIRVSNRLEKGALSAEELGRIYQQGYTTKQGHDGVGLSSIRSLASRYHGVIYTELEGDIIHFVAKIPINYAQMNTEP